MGRVGRQLLPTAAARGEGAGSHANVVTIDSLLEFHAAGEEEPYTHPQCRLLLRLGPPAVTDDGWRQMPASLQGVLAQSYAIPGTGLASFLRGWLLAREDQYPVVVVLLDGAENEELAQLQPMVDVLHRVRGTLHLVTERDLSAQEAAAGADSVVLAAAGQGAQVAAGLFTALCADTAEELWSCLDDEDWRPAWGTAAKPSEFVRAWWRPADEAVVFPSAADQTRVAKSPYVVATVFDRQPLGYKGAITALHELVETGGGDLMFAVPLEFLRPKPDELESELRPIHLLCRRP